MRNTNHHLLIHTQSQCMMSPPTTPHTQNPCMNLLRTTCNQVTKPHSQQQLLHMNSLLLLTTHQLALAILHHLHTTLLHTRNPPSMNILVIGDQSLNFQHPQHHQDQDNILNPAATTVLPDCLIILGFSLKQKLLSF